MSIFAYSLSHVNIRETEGFKQFKKEYIDIKFGKRGGWLGDLITYDGIEDQILLPDYDIRSHVYQYNMYLRKSLMSKL